MKIEISPVAYVKNIRKEITDDNWGEVVSDLVLVDKLPPESLLGLEEFSHAEIIFYFNRTIDTDIKFTRHPRNNRNFPLTGIFAQRGKDRPNHIGITISEIVGVNGNILTVKGLDALDGTPVIDIKPVLKEFFPSAEIKQPVWSSELMRKYWKS